MQVLFTHGYFLAEDPQEQAIMKPYPPLGLLYLSAWLEKHGIENEVFDTTFSSKTALKTFLLEHRPRIVALYTNLMTKRNVLQIIRFIRETPDLQHCLVVLGGPDVTHNLADYLAGGADLAVIGEGEQTMLEIALSADTRTADTGVSFGHIAGIAFLQPGGSVRQTPPREKLRDLEQLPFPNRQKIDLQQYINAWKRAHGHSVVSISTQRGCPYTCRWCSTAVYGQSYRRRSPENVVNEIAALQKQYDFDMIWFVDDVFTVSHKWLEAFHKELSDRQIKIRYECITRADRLNGQVIQTLRDSGCFRVWIGAESGSQRIIDAMDRRVDVNEVRNMIKAARRAGIEAGTFIMLGYPGETESDIRDTVRHLKEANPDWFTITIAYPIKGTGLYEEVQGSLQSALPWPERSDRDLDFKRTYPRPYYDYAVRWTVNSVLWHKARLSGIQGRHLVLPLKVLAARLGMWRWKRPVV